MKKQWVTQWIKRWVTRRVTQWVVLAFVVGLVLALLPVGVRAWGIPPRSGIGSSPLSAAIATLPASPEPAKKPAAAPTAEKPPELKPFNEVIQDTIKFSGLFTLYQNPKTGKLFAELQPEQFQQRYLAALTLESGIGERGIYSGLPIGDFLFSWRRVNNTVQFVVPNLYFRAAQGSPVARSLRRSFSDSVLEVFPIRSIHPDRKSLLIELNSLLLSDVPGLLPVLSASLGNSYNLDPKTSYVGTVKAFPLNVEIESIYGFTGSDPKKAARDVPALPDSRTFNLKVHYSLSQLPQNSNYRPRLADDRIGYFITAYKDLTDDTDRQAFVRLINRWHLEKADPTAPLSKPKQPIVFWIDNAVPLEYRDAVQEGVLLWNQAFQDIGFQNAIEVKQMPEKVDWDPADVRYNTIRWFNATDAIFAMGPSRVNPLTGEILDADVVVAADFVRALKEEYRNIVEQPQRQPSPFATQILGQDPVCNYGMSAGMADRYRQIQRRSLNQSESPSSESPPIAHPEDAPTPRLRFASPGDQQSGNQQDLCLGIDAAKQFAVGSLSLSLLQNLPPDSPAMKQFIHDFIRELIAHEIGHTLGLRHNFRGSAMLKPSELNNPTITRKRGLVSSVMDYNPINLAPPGTRQGDYFTHVLGPYDRWAISYGYQDIPTQNLQEEKQVLDLIARRAPQANLAYATDEDARANLDPKVHRFDLSSDLLTYSQWQLQNARRLWQRIEQRYPPVGESFYEARVAFNAVFDYYFEYATFLTEYVGGRSFNRYKSGDAAGRLPFEAVPIAQQRKALKLLQEHVFNERVFQFSPNFLNKLAPSRWSHWGTRPQEKLEYPIHDTILFVQSVVLADLLSPDRLARLRDGDLKTPPGQSMTIPELFQALRSATWGEVMPGKSGIELSSLRRALQRQYLDTLIAMVLRQTEVPDDARSVARYQLKQLQQVLDRTLTRDKKIDLLTQAHLDESRDRIAQALAAQLRSH